MSPSSSSTGSDPDFAADPDLEAWLWLRKRWLLSRIILVLLAVTVGLGSWGDVIYYADNLDRWFGGHGLDGVLREYPLPVLGLLLPSWLLAGANATAFLVTFPAAMVVCDLAFTAQIWRAVRRRVTPALRLWVYGLPMLGPLALTRFDLVPGVLAGAAVLLLVRRPAWSGIVLAVGASLKLWPVLLLPPLLVRRAGSGALLAAFTASGLLVALGCMAIAGRDRLLSPLTYQQDRGLQIESLPALPLMLAWLFDSDRWQVTIGRFLSAQVSGPGESALLAVSTVATACGLVLVGLLCLRGWRRGGQLPPVAVAWLCLTAVTVLVVTNKVFSPQYLLWLLPIVVAGLVLQSDDPALRRVAWLLVVAGMITQFVYPVGYSLLVYRPHLGSPFCVGLLVGRDALLLILLAVAVRRSWSLTGASASRLPGARQAEVEHDDVPIGGGSAPGRLLSLLRRAEVAVLGS